VRSVTIPVLRARCVQSARSHRDAASDTPPSSPQRRLHKQAIVFGIGADMALSAGQQVLDTLPLVVVKCIGAGAEPVQGLLEGMI
jgi:hypothetical protein